MGKVISYYREKRRYKTQQAFAIAAGVTLRAVQEWESSVMRPDLERRVLLAKMLKIPPALLGLDWRLTTYQDNTGQHPDALTRLPELFEEDTYYLYEDTLVMGWKCLYSGKLLEIADRIERRLRKPEKIVIYRRC